MARTTTLHLLPVPRALEAIGEQLAEQESVNVKIAESLVGIRHALEAMNERVAAHDKFRASVSKYIGAILTPLAVALIVYLVRLSWVVQNNHIIGSP
jgi:hypothetical protein